MRLNLPSGVPERALAIVAHPDDAEFQCGATLAKWAAAGCEVHHLVCTDGSKGTWDVSTDTSALIDIRQDEQRAAARALGATGDCWFLGFVDGELDASLESRRRVAEVIRRVQPDVVLGHDPWKRYRLHPDHRNAGLLAVEGIVAARDPHFFPGAGGEHHRPSALLLFEADEADLVEDVTGYADRKVAALLEHVSQFVTTHDITDPSDEAQVARFRRHVESRLEEHGRAAGVRHGEQFKLIDRL